MRQQTTINRDLKVNRDIYVCGICVVELASALKRH